MTKTVSKPKPKCSNCWFYNRDGKKTNFSCYLHRLLKDTKYCQEYECYDN